MGKLKKTKNVNKTKNVKKTKNVNKTKSVKKTKIVEKSKKAVGFKSELAKLAEKDPDFFEYLKTDEADIFEFCDGDEAVSDEDMEEDDFARGAEDSDDELASALDEEEGETDNDESLEIDQDSDEDEDEVDDEDKIDDDVNNEDKKAIDSNESVAGNAMERDDLESKSDEDEIEEDRFELVKLTTDGTLSAKVQRNPLTGNKVVDLNLLRLLTKVLSEPVVYRRALLQAVKVSVQCFNACISSIGGGDKSKTEQQKVKRVKGKKPKKKASLLKSEYVVNSDELFGEVIHMCFTYLGRCFMILMNPIEKEKDEGKLKKKKNLKKKPKRSSATTFKNWHKYGALTRQYLLAVYTFLNELQHNEDILEDGLKGVADLVDIYLHFPKLCKHLVKLVVKFWSRRNEAVQSATFIVLCKMIRLDNEIFAQVYKACYVSYISNCKQVNAETLPLIKFMQKSITELSFLVPKQAYEYAFVYIRQFIVHLRNALTAKRKDLIQSVYNWQFLNGIALWTMVISQSAKTPNLFAWFKDLCHPLIEIIVLEQKIFMAGKYLPLGIFCVHLLLQIQMSCRVFIPTLSMAINLLEHLQLIDKKKPLKGKEVEKAIEFTEIFRLSKSQLEDSGIRLALAEELFKLCLECSVAIKNNPAFPKIVVPLEHSLKSFINECHNHEHVELFKMLNQKLKEHAAELVKVISALDFDLQQYNDSYDQMFAAANKNSALTKFYTSYTKSLELKLEAKRSAEKRENQPTENRKLKRKHVPKKFLPKNNFAKKSFARKNIAKKKFKKVGR